MYTGSLAGVEDMREGGGGGAGEGLFKVCWGGGGLGQYTRKVWGEA